MIQIRGRKKDPSWYITFNSLRCTQDLVLMDLVCFICVDCQNVPSLGTGKNKLLKERHFREVDQKMTLPRKKHGLT